MSVQSNGVSHWLGAKLGSALYCVHGSSVVSICVKSQNQGQCYLLDCDWFQQACLSTGPWLTWFQQAGFVFNTGELSQTGRNFPKVCTLPPQLLDICTPDLVMGPKWVNHYKVVLSSWRQLSSLACERAWDFGVFFFLWGNFLVVSGGFKSMWVVHFISPFLYTLAFFVNFYTVICYWLLVLNQLAYFVSLCCG